jgi:thiol:disulfide interchange protein DsbD
VSLEPLVLGVRPGERFWLAAHFRIAPGYRISWKNPGEVGTATTVAFRAPPGFEVGNVQFPAPERYTAQGSYTGFGYANETAVFVEVKAKPSLGGSDVSRFDIDAGWVACKQECSTEHTSAFVELTTASSEARATEAESALAPFRARLPKPLRDVHEAEARWEAATLVVKIPGATPSDFISDGTGDPKPSKTSFASEEARFKFDEAPRPGSRPLRGIVIAKAEGKDAFYDLEAPLPGETAEPPPPKQNAPKKRR